MIAELEICHSCLARAVNVVLDCGPQPVGNRFLHSRHAAESLFPLVVGQCAACGLIQLGHPAPVDELRPRFDWISYTEPDAHLDALVEELTRLPGIVQQSHVGAVVLGQDKTLECFEKRGFRNTWQIDLQRDLGVAGPYAGTETLQSRLTPASAGCIAEKQGLFDLLVVRHMVEHAHHVQEFLAAIRSMIKPDGYAIFEVPDCETAFATCDYSILWEEHVFYFMPATFRHCLETAGFAVLGLQRPTYSLVALTRPQPALQPPRVPPLVLQAEIDRMSHFASSLPRLRQCTQDALRRLSGPVAFFGAGHMACTYISLLELGGALDCVVDDHPQKRGMFMPGSRLPVVGSDALAHRGITACISALSPGSEARVAAKNASFTAAGGRFLSIFSGRPNSLLIESCD
jgi:methyltransferase family protein/putative zinc binding protein/C-methyltransferase-like protein